MSKKLTRELISQKVKSDRIESIRNLNLWGSNIEDISILEQMPSLEVVSLSVNKIRTLKPFSNLRNLRELYLRRNLISNLNEIKFLSQCENLNVLWLSENPICDNPNYRDVVICVLPQLQKLDDIAITDEERDKAENKINLNIEEDDDEEIDENNNRENGENLYENNNRRNINDNRNKYNERDDEEDDYNKPKKNYEQNRNKQNDEYGRFNDNNDRYNYKYNYDERPIKGNNNYYGNNNNNNNNNNNYRKNNNYGDNNMKYKDNYQDNDYNDYKEKKRGNSNVLNCVINLLKELSPNELKVVKKEIDRMNNY